MLPKNAEYPPSEPAAAGEGSLLGFWFGSGRILRFAPNEDQRTFPPNYSAVPKRRKVRRCRTSGARNSSGHRTQPFRAGLASGAPPALWLWRGRFGICALTRPTWNLRVVARDSRGET